MMHSIIASSLRLRVFVVAFAAVLTVAGVWQLRDVPLDAVPEFSPVTLVVKTEALGLSSTEVESLITVPIEADLLNGVPWLQSIESESITGLSSIEMTFEPGTDYMRARQMVQERLTQAHALPNVSAPPTLLQPISTTSRVMNIGLSSKDVSLIEMSVQARWTIVPRLLGVPGVANVAVWGHRDRQIQIHVKPESLRAQDVTLEEVVKTAGEAVWASPLTFLNSSTPGTGGFIETPNQRLNIRHQAPITTPSEFAKVPVYGTAVALGDVAVVVEGHQPLIGDALLRDGTGLMLVVDKFPGFNTQDVTRGVEAALRELKPGMTGIEIDTAIFRPASFIERATRQLSFALAASYILLLIALGALMGSWRTALVAAVTVTLSLLAAVLVLTLWGVNVNMMVLAGLFVAIGAVVHDSILDVAIIRQRVQEARSDTTRRNTGRVIAAALLEARRPMVYATLIIVVAVVPILFLQGLSAAFFEPLIWSYIVAVAAAMLISLIVTPALSLMLLPQSLGGVQQGAAGGPGPVPAPLLIAPLLRQFERLLGLATRSSVPAFGLAVVALGVSYLVWTSLERSMLPNFRETDIAVEIQAAPGTSLPAMTRATSALMGDFQAIPGVRNVAAQIGRAVLCNCDETADVNSAEVWVNIDPDANYDATLAAIEESAATYPGLAAKMETYLSRKMREALTGSEETVTVRVYGHDLNILRAKAEEIQGILAKIEGIENPRVEQIAAESTLEVEVDLERAGRYGLKPGDIRRAASTLVGGITVGALFQEQKVFDVVVWGAPQIRDNLSDIENLLIDVEDAGQVRLADVAHVRIGQSNSVIGRQGVSRGVDVDADVSGRSVSEVAREVARQISAVPFPFEYHAEVLGEDVERRSALESIYAQLAAAAVVIFLLTQAATGSWRLAALSALGVPVALMGGFLAVAIAGGTFSLGSLLGFVAILGLTARNAIMVVKHFQYLEQSGAEVFGETLIRRGVREQFLPVIATALTVALVALPFVVLGDSAGLEIAHPMAVVILGGVVTSVLVTLIMTPAFYLKFGAGSSADVLGLEVQT